ncbi:MAG: hypothetical protein E6767_00550 [Dysgonomonas sp.]|nr:hypothetical protein [Dysgonomonas sp.]
MQGRISFILPKECRLWVKPTVSGMNDCPDYPVERDNSRNPPANMNFLIKHI